MAVRGVYCELVSDFPVSKEEYRESLVFPVSRYRHQVGDRDSPRLFRSGLAPTGVR